MGKRELLIIVAFLAVGTVAYQFTAPEVPEDEGFSISRIVEGIRNEVRGNPGSAEAESTGTIPVTADLSEVRISGTSRGIEVQGEDRDDIGYTLRVSSNGPDDALALTYAQAVQVVTEDLGFAVGIRLSYPREAQQRASLILRVPARLAVQIEGRSGATVSDVAAVDLENVLGEAVLRNVSGRVSGSHRSGPLVIEGAGSVDITLSSSRAEMGGVRERLRVNARNGEVIVRGAGGPVEIEQVNLELEVEAPASTVYVTGTGGEIRILDPAGEVRVDARGAEVELEMNTGVTVTVLTSDDTVRLALGPDATLELDAATTGGGEIQAGDVGLTPETSDDGARLAHVFGRGGARVSLRNSDGDIVIRRRQ